VARYLCGDQCEDVVNYFQRIANGKLYGRQELELNLFRIDQAVSWTCEFRDFQPIVSALRGVILDDPNTSNHHVYLSLAVCAGSILYLDHDGDSRIVFPDLDALVTAAEGAVVSTRSLRSYHPVAAVILQDQQGLSQLISDLLNGHYDCDGNEVALALIPSMDLRDFELLNRLAQDNDFYLAEAVGDAIARRARPDLKPLAEICASHQHRQAAAAGKRALLAIRAQK
jgi:hypothetical protein